jgi:hypothetical protein
LSPEKSPLKDENVEQNVIAVTTPESMDIASANTSTNDDQTGPGNSPSSPRPHSRSPPPGTINMSGLRTALPDIALNSPSTNIVGTPFAHTTTNTPFEYPFPDTPADSASSLPSHPNFRPGSPHGTFQPPPQPPPPADGQFKACNSGTFNLKHPKYTAEPPASPPPVPPSLKKKRWSLNFLGRRRTSNPPTPTGDGPSSPLGTPPAVTSGAILGGLGGGRPKLGNRTSSKCGEGEGSRKSTDKQ